MSAAPVLRGRALVTGGSSGLGLAFARALAARGCDLVLVARDAERLAATAKELAETYRVDVETMPADLSLRDEVETVAARLADLESPIEILVNNAGHGVRTKLTDRDTSPHESAVDLMVRAVLVLGGTAGRVMAERGHGVIVNMSSVAGLIAMGSYSAIKAFVHTYSDALSLELAGTGVRVVTLLPGWVRTEFHDRAGISPGSIPDSLYLDADRVVRTCLADVERGRTRSVPSARYKVLAWLAEHGPRSAVRRVTATMVRSRR